MGALHLNKIGKKMKKTLALIPLGGALASAFAQDASSASSAATALATNLTNLTTDVTSTIGPAAIGLVVAVAMVVVGRQFIKKFFKA